MGFEESVVWFGAPTLAGLKLGSLFCHCPQSETFPDTFRALRSTLLPLGLDLTILQGDRNINRYLLYLYRVEELNTLLRREDIGQYLTVLGYPPLDRSRLLVQLASRLRRGAFPHEIGLFLGYPLADVQGFIQNGGQNCLCSGCWKVYSDPEAARRRFSRYRACTVQYRARYIQGTPISELIVAA